jgi:hypothetical protein
MVTNLNKTKNPPQKKYFETSYSTRGTTQITKFLQFRHFTSSDKPFAFTQHYGRSLLSLRRSVLRLGGDGSLEGFAIGSQQPPTLSRLFNPTVLVMVIIL